MKRGDGPNAGVEFLHKLSQKQDFVLFLRGIRGKLELPENGSSDSAIRIKCQKDPRRMAVFVIALETLIRDYKIPRAYIGILDNYIFGGDHALDKQEHPAVASIEAPPGVLHDMDLEKYYRDAGEPYAKVLIFGNAKKEAVVNFIKTQWGEIEGILEKQGRQPVGRTNETKNKKRNSRIKELAWKSIEELQKLVNSKSRRRDILIGSILIKEGYKEISDGYIRNIIQK